MHNVGCLTAITSGDGQDLLEPREDCDDDRASQQFRFEPSGPPTAGRYRVRIAATDRCLALRGEELGEGVELVQGLCSEALAQRFLVDLVQPPP
ncbi:RICIN domain-containing protein [Actinosynnema sp. NPDC004786]